ncbi:hypothetical protein GCM10011578_094750 [Streptomyces fuscichromogenes]|uniref:Insertion element IS402-like domain-containing protein n=1 Tax=Streptomyces fuscichromogenes TaxID=1324013 RepID=A0A917XPV8_9ACTN|nr:hypothetical protein GCM10011578_094750 [Streptomyces fuscichromogenes]
MCVRFGWDGLEPPLPQRERRLRYPGRKALPDREVLCGILYVLHTGIRWEHLPKERGFSSGMTCRRRLRDWNEDGVRHPARRPGTGLGTYLSFLGLAAALCCYKRLLKPTM